MAVMWPHRAFFLTECPFLPTVMWSVSIQPNFDQPFYLGREFGPGLLPAERLANSDLWFSLHELAATNWYASVQILLLQWISEWKCQHTHWSWVRWHLYSYLWVSTFPAEDPFIGCDKLTERWSLRSQATQYYTVTLCWCSFVNRHPLLNVFDCAMVPHCRYCYIV